MNLKFTPLKRRPLEGNLNHYHFFQDQNGRVVLCRKPIENRVLWNQIKKEYEGIGFFQLGGKIRRRSPIEQGLFCNICVERGLPVITPIIFSAMQGWYPFIDGISYDRWLTAGGTSIGIINSYIDSVIKAHQEGIVYGDRWGPNTMVVDNTTIIHFDFDICLKGIPSKEFEFAQTLYYTLCFSSRKVVVGRYLTQLLRSIKRSELYNWEMLSKLIEGHYRYFASTKYRCKRRLILNGDVLETKDRR